MFTAWSFLQRNVSVPIRGLFNLTNNRVLRYYYVKQDLVSVPIRGLFNLTKWILKILWIYTKKIGFRPHQGII